ncbi:unnamed protein product [Cuscuta europaea]|uniref:Uncharacterized protein n=1 Tax=Cuscuta europaea TaxID=41803 RepID=A0A9P0Z7W5_CUSEU|nr:unnamed protein product [Cuscuta europaea]
MLYQLHEACAADMPPAEGIDPGSSMTKVSYAVAVKDPILGQRLHSQNVSFSDAADLGSSGTLSGFPSISFSVNELRMLSHPFRYALVGTFPFGRPPISAIRKAFAAIGFSQPYSVGQIQSNIFLVIHTYHHRKT